MAFGQTDLGNNVDWSGAYPYFKENVIRPDVDVFIHTWGENNPEWGKLVEAYNPLSGNMEPQKEFLGCPETKSIHSRWYSALHSVCFPLAEQIVGDKEYSGILLARYDLVFKVKFPWDDLDPKFFWTSKWRQKPARDSGYLDYWFYGNPDDMDNMVQLNHNLDEFFKNGVKENGHSVVEAQIKKAGLEPRVQQWGEQPEDFQLLRRMLGASN
jgi:hypothetical protein